MAADISTSDAEAGADARDEDEAPAPDATHSVGTDEGVRGTTQQQTSSAADQQHDGPRVDAEANMRANPDAPVGDGVAAEERPRKDTEGGPCESL